MPATGILAIRRAGEDQYHTLELCLTLCGREDASDTHLQNLIGAVDGNRRGSFMPALTSSDERTKLFETRLGLRVITSFLDHNSGEPGQWTRRSRRSGTPPLRRDAESLVAATSESPADPASLPPLASPPPP